MKYLLMVRVDEALPLSPEEQAAHLDAVGSWARALDSRGVRLLGNRLRPAADAAVVRVRDGKLLVSDGPYAETKEQMGGFDVIEVADRAEALAIASQHPGAEYGTVEVHPVWE